MTAAPALVLATRSPQRRALIARLGLDVAIQPSAVDEAALATPADPPGIVQALASAKARDVAGGRPSAIVLGADTLVALDRETLGKPADEAAATAMLRRLSGQMHAVLTGLTVIAPAPTAHGNGRTEIGESPALARARAHFPALQVAQAERRIVLSLTVQSTVRFRTLAAAEIAAYVASGEPMDKAGAYGIQGVGGRLIAALDGCYTNVVGLPLCAVAALLPIVLGRAVACAPDAGCRISGGAACLCAAMTTR